MYYVLKHNTMAVRLPYDPSKSEENFNTLTLEQQEYIKERAAKIEAFVEAASRQEEREKLSEFRKELRESKSTFHSNTSYLPNPEECFTMRDSIKLDMEKGNHKRVINLNKDMSHDDVVSILLMYMEYLDSRNIMIDDFQKRFKLMVINYIARDDARNSEKDKNIKHGLHFIIGDPIMIELMEVTNNPDVVKMPFQSNTMLSLKGYWRWRVDGRKIQTGTAGSTLVRGKESSTVIVSFYEK